MGIADLLVLYKDKRQEHGEAPVNKTPAIAKFQLTNNQPKQVKFKKITQQQYQEMSIRDTRAGFTQARFNDDASSLVIFEILIIAVAFGIGMQSWWWGGGIFLGGMIVMVTPILNILFCLAMTAAWAVTGFHIGEAIGQEGANYVIAIISGLVSLGAHLGAIEWAEDLGAKD